MSTELMKYNGRYSAGPHLGNGVTRMVNCLSDQPTPNADGDGRSNAKDHGDAASHGPLSRLGSVMKVEIRSCQLS